MATDDAELFNSGGKLAVSVAACRRRPPPHPCASFFQDGDLLARGSSVRIDLCRHQPQRCHRL